MAADKDKKTKAKRKSKNMRGRMPSKRSINLILINENRINPMLAIPGIILIIVGALLFSKFGVYDRIVEISSAQGRVSQLETVLNSKMDEINKLSDVEDAYAHYTVEGMTQDELNLVDRVGVLNLVTRFLPKRTGLTSSWSVSGNILTIEMNERDLRKLNDIARKMEKSPIVNSCAVSTVNMSKNEAQNSKTVRGRLVVYLQQPPEGYEWETEDEFYYYDETEEDDEYIGASSETGEDMEAESDMNQTSDVPNETEIDESNGAADWAKGFIRGVDES